MKIWSTFKGSPKCQNNYSEPKRMQITYHLRAPRWQRRCSINQNDYSLINSTYWGRAKMQQRHQFQIMWQSTNSTYRLVNTYHRQGTILGKEQDTALHSRKDVKYTKKKLDTFAKVKETPQKHIYENIQ